MREALGTEEYRRAHELRKAYMREPSVGIHSPYWRSECGRSRSPAEGVLQNAWVSRLSDRSHRRRALSASTAYRATPCRVPVRRSTVSVSLQSTK